MNALTADGLPNLPSADSGYPERLGYLSVGQPGRDGSVHGLSAAPSVGRLPSPLTHLLATARSAVSTSRLVDVGIGRVEQMATWARGLARVHAGWAETSQLIHARRHHLEVRWSDAQRRPAQMVDLHPLRDWAVRHLVGHPMRPLKAAVGLDSAITLEGRRGPEPAVTRLVDLLPEPLRERTASRHYPRFYSTHTTRS